MELFRHLQVVPAKPAALLPAAPERVVAPQIVRPAPAGFTDFWHLVRARWLTVTGAALLCGTAACLLTLPQPPIYQAQTSLEIQGLNENFLHMSDVTPNADLYSTEGYVQTQVDVLESRSLIRRAAEKTAFASRFHDRGMLARWMPAQPEKPSDESTLKAIYKRLRIRTAPPTRLIRITFDSADPRLAADFANALAAEYVRHS